MSSTTSLVTSSATTTSYSTTNVSMLSHQQDKLDPVTEQALVEFIEFLAKREQPTPQALNQRKIKEIDVEVAGLRREIAVAKEELTREAPLVKEEFAKILGPSTVSAETFATSVGPRSNKQTYLSCLSPKQKRHLENLGYSL